MNTLLMPPANVWKRIVDATRILAPQSQSVGKRVGENPTAALSLGGSATEAFRALFMSGCTGGALALQGLLAADHRFSPRPFTPELLLQRVRELLDRR